MRITFDEIESLAQSPLSFPALCERYPDDKPLRFYQERDGLSEVSPRALRRRVAALGAELAGVCEPGQRAVLLLPRVEDYVIGLLACFHANVVAVPTVVDAANRSAASAEMIASVAADSEAVCLLADPGTARWIADKDAAAGRRLLTVPAGEPAGDGEDGRVGVADAALVGAEAAGDDHPAVLCERLADRCQALGLGAVEEAAGIDDDRLGAGVVGRDRVALGAEPGRDRLGDRLFVLDHEDSALAHGADCRSHWWRQPSEI